MEKPGCCLYYNYNYNHYIYGAVASTGSGVEAAVDAYSAVNN